MQISKIFYSIQGEGPKTGEKAVFIRLAGCNLRCSFCDSKYAYHGRELKLNELIAKIKKYDCNNIIWTGGEPALQIKEICKVIKKLKNYKHSIETNGTFYFPAELFKTIVISPKKQSINKTLIKKYKELDNVYFKFVVGDLKDYIFWKKFIKDLKIKKQKVYFMPEASNKITLIKNTKWVKVLVKKDNFNFSGRLQILKAFR